MRVNIYLKANLHSLIPPFTEYITQSMKKGICLYDGIVNTFFCEKPLRIWDNVI